MTSIGSLFAGYGGLDLAVEAAIPDARPVWFSEVDAAPARILAHHWPGVPNHGDITAINWSQVEPVDTLTAGFPCQDVSLAGKRAGLRDGTRTGLWRHVVEAIAALKPRLVVLENVRGLLSTAAVCPVEPGPWDLGDRSGGPILRALGAVLGDLADLGFDADWGVLAASAVGAPHKRERVFIVASHRESGGAQAVYDCAGSQATCSAGVRRIDGNTRGATSPIALLPTPRATDGTKGGPNQRGSSGDLMLPSAVLKLLSTPKASDASSGGQHPDKRQGHSRQLIDDVLLAGTPAWGKYQPAIDRWTRLTRPAPAPTELGTRGNPRLAAPFPEWMMGLPEGWVTSPEIGLTRAQQLKACGNGVVPQQAMAAFRQLLHDWQKVRWRRDWIGERSGSALRTRKP